MESHRKSARVATETRLDVRVMLDPHMGAIYSRLAAVPQRLRGRELLALARLAVGQLECGVPRAAVPTAQSEGATGKLGPAHEGRSGAADPGSELEHLGGFADATPPLH